jgi:16S rRNA (cytosine1402-N4)-methyltransferase
MKKNTHNPVLITKILENLQPKSLKKIVDATFGLGGYAMRIFQSGFTGKYLGIDADKHNLDIAKKNLIEFDKQLSFFNGNFSEISTIVQSNGFEDADAFIFDLGLCSTHVDNPERGFSFQSEGPLDMRFGNQELNAETIVNRCPPSELCNIFEIYGEEKLAKKITDEIIHIRKKTPITSTSQLAGIVTKVYESVGIFSKKRHPATKTFQALRMAVNDELGVIKKALMETIKIMKPLSKIYVVTYHSLEDRTVKEIFRQAKKGGNVKWINKHVIIPDFEEVKSNRRARSAKLRIVEKLKDM